MKNQIRDHKFKTNKIALLLRHENFTITSSNSVQNPDGTYAPIIYVGFIDHTVDEWAEVSINLKTGKAELANF